MGNLWRKFWKKLPRSLRRRVIRCVDGPNDDEKLLALPDSPSGSIPLFGSTFHFVHSPSLKSIHHEIFKKRYYHFISETETPVILDLGANMGLSILYFKNLYPKASITAYEADPVIFQALQKNMKSYGLEDVVLHNKAAWKADTILPFCSTLDCCGHLTGQSSAKTLDVPAERISPHLAVKVDVLKMDVEGAEMEILRECEPCLCNVKRIFVEYHSSLSAPSGLHELLNLLERNHFDYVLNDVKSAYLGSEFKPPRHGNFAYAVDIAAWRTD